MPNTAGHSSSAQQPNATETQRDESVRLVQLSRVVPRNEISDQTTNALPPAPSSVNNPSIHWQPLTTHEPPSPRNSHDMSGRTSIITRDSHPSLRVPPVNGPSTQVFGPVPKHSTMLIPAHSPVHNTLYATDTRTSHLSDDAPARSRNAHQPSESVETQAIGLRPASKISADIKFYINPEWIGCEACRLANTEASTKIMEKASAKRYTARASARRAADALMMRPCPHQNLPGLTWSEGAQQAYDEAQDELVSLVCR
jgi:hypothetical protein